MPETLPKMIRLNPDAWSDNPQVAIEELLAIGTGDIVIDASEASEVTAQAAQLLISARITAQARSNDLCLFQPTEGVQTSLENLGMSGLFKEINA